LTLDSIAKEIERHRCDLELCNNRKRYVYGEGAPNAHVMFVGEAPGAQEEEEGRPFVGRAGKLLDNLITYMGMWRPQVYITNIIKVRPPNNRDPTLEEIAHYLPWLHDQIECIEPKVIVTLGRFALSYFAPNLKIGDAHGVFLIDPEYMIFPMYHPSAALHDGRLKDTLFTDAEMLANTLADLL
jgi:DNA polymerase